MSFDVTGDLVNAGTIVGSEIVKASVFLDLNQAATGQSVTIDDVAFPSAFIAEPPTVTQPDAVHLTYEVDSPDTFTPNGLRMV